MARITQNGIFPTGSTLPIPGGRLAKGGPAESWLAMHNAAAHDGVDLRPGGPASSARNRSQQWYFWTHQPPPAARPYTSNHGWGRAVDDPDARAQAWLRAHAHRFGWSHDEGARVGEAWHWRYVGGGDRALIRKWLNPDPLRGLTNGERLMANRLRYHRRLMRAEERSGKGKRWHKQLGYARAWKAKLVRQMRRLRKDATKRGGGGWARNGRGRRYQILKHVLEGNL